MCDDDETRGGGTWSGCGFGTISSFELCPLEESSLKMTLQTARSSSCECVSVCVEGTMINKFMCVGGGHMNAVIYM